MIDLVQYCENLYNEEYAGLEENISFKAEKVDMPKGLVPEEIQDDIINSIFACQNGVMRNIPSIPDTVETSSNLAIVKVADGVGEVKILARSASDSMKEYLTTSIECCFNMAGAKVEMSGAYSGWDPDVNSPILHVKEKDVNLIRNLSNVDISLVALPGKALQGKIYHISDMMDEDTRSVEVLIECSNADRQMKPGMYGTVKLTDNPTPKILIPASAVLQEEDNNYVLVSIGNNKYIKRKVTTVSATGERLVILSGLNAGEHAEYRCGKPCIESSP